jgi:DNA-binding transcriptional MocR family regulator
MPSGRRSAYVRTSFSVIEEAEAEEAFKRLRKVIQEVQQEASART